MKTYCKHNLLHDRKFCLDMVYATFHRKWNRKNYQRTLAHYCKLPLRGVRALINQGRKDELEYGLLAIVDEFQRELDERNFELTDIDYSERIDGLSGKLRIIGIMSVKQQCYEHIIVGALMPLFNTKITPHQYASMEKRGQVAGMKKIRRWIRNDNWSAKCAREHGGSYSRKCTCFVKLDVTQCFPSITSKTVMRYLRHDISKNSGLLWAVEELLKIHEQEGRGLVIGSLLSQFICNYLLSFAYRHVMSLSKERRGKRVKLVSHALFFMDDILLIGSDRRNLKMAVRSMIRFAKQEIGLIIKGNWHVKSLVLEPIDMMGYVIHSDGHVTIRARIFLRTRRAYLRATRRTMTVEFARRLMAYNGYFVHTASHDIRENLDVKRLRRIARRTIRKHDRKENMIHGQCSSIHRRLCAC